MQVLICKIYLTLYDLLLPAPHLMPSEVRHEQAGNNMWLNTVQERSNSTEYQMSNIITKILFLWNR